MEKLEIDRVSVNYQRGKKIIPALRNVSLTLSAGETLGLVGESGSGKSTLALAILRLIRPEEGQITNGRIIYTHSTPSPLAGEGADEGEPSPRPSPEKGE